MAPKDIPEKIEFETVKIGDSLRGDYKKVQDAMDAINGEKHKYLSLIHI